MKRQLAGGVGETEAKRGRNGLDEDAVAVRLQQFIQANSLDERCVATLRELTPAQQDHVMNQEFIVQIDPKKGNASALVVGRCKQARADPVEHSPEADSSLAEFIVLNSLDARCAETLRGLTEEQLQWVMAQQFVVQVDPSRGSASALVVGRCKKAKDLYPGTNQAAGHLMPSTMSSRIDFASQAGGELQLQLEQYITVNNVDDRCIDTLRSLSEEQLRWVMDQEFHVQVDPSRGNASALIAGRCKKVKTMDYIPRIRPQNADHLQLPSAPLASHSSTANLHSQLEMFISVNSLDDGCIRMLRALPEDQLQWVLAQEFYVQADPAKGSASALVVGRCKKAAYVDLTQSQVRPNAHLQAQLEQFIAMNSLDERCAALLRELSEDQLTWVMNQEFMVQADPTRGSTSAVVVGRCKRAKTLDFNALQNGHHMQDSAIVHVGNPLVINSTPLQYQHLPAYAGGQSLQSHLWHSGVGPGYSVQTQSTVGNNSSQLDLFISLNHLDPRCAETLRELSHEQQQWVMAQEFVVQVDPSRGSASALVVGRCMRAKILDMKSSQVADQPIMALAPPSNSPPLPAVTGTVGPASFPAHLVSGQLQYSQQQLPLYSAGLGQVSQGQGTEQLQYSQQQLPGYSAVLGQVAQGQGTGQLQYSQQQLPGYSDGLGQVAQVVPAASGSVKSRLDQFIFVNSLDESCAEKLYELSDEQLNWVMEQEFVVQIDPSKGNASALVVGRCKRAKAIDFTRSQASNGFNSSAVDGAAADLQSRLQMYISINGLDDRCAALLRELTDEQLQWVLDQELVVQVDRSRGNASALVVGRCKKAKAIDFARLRAANSIEALQGAAGPFQSRLAQFISQNNLDERCAGILRTMPEDQANWVMDLEFIVRVDPSKGSASGLVVGRCKRAGALAATGVSLANSSASKTTLEPHDQRLQQFIAVNNLDEHCSIMLRSLSQYQASWVMDQEFVVNFDPARGNAAALVVGRCNKARAVAMTSADSSASHALRLQQFIALNHLDEACTASLHSLTENQAKLVMDQEFHVQIGASQGSASCLVLDRCNHVKASAAASLQYAISAHPVSNSMYLA